MPVTAIQGLRGTGEFDADHRPKNYRELFTLLEPNGNAPLNALLAMGQSESTDDPEFKNFRDELPDRVAQAAAAAAAGVSPITLAAGTENKFFIAGAIVVNATTGEVMQVTADTTGTSLAVTRNIGGTAFAVSNGDKLFVAGFAAAENGLTPTPVSFDAVIATNYTQIFKTAFGLSNTLKATKLRTGSKEQEVTTKALKMHMSDIERAMIFGRKFEANGTSSTPTRYTGGLLNSISTVVDATSGAYTGGIISETKFDELLISTIFKYGSKQKIAFVGWQVAALLQQIGKNRWQPITVEGSYGVNLTKYSTFAGDLLIHLHPQFRQVPGMDNAMVVVDFPNVRYRYLDGRDTELLENRQGNNQDGVLHEYRTECGLELTQDKVHAYIKNWSKLA